MFEHGKYLGCKHQLSSADMLEGCYTGLRARQFVPDPYSISISTLRNYCSKRLRQVTNECPRRPLRHQTTICYVNRRMIPVVRTRCASLGGEGGKWVGPRRSTAASNPPGGPEIGWERCGRRVCGESTSQRSKKKGAKHHNVRHTRPCPCCVSHFINVVAEYKKICLV